MKDLLVKQAGLKRCLHEISYKDENDATGAVVGLPVIALSRETVCKSLMFKSLKVTHEDYTLDRKRTKFAIMVRLAECWNENIDVEDKSVEEVAVEAVAAETPHRRLLQRSDSGFTRDSQDDTSNATPKPKPRYDSPVKMREIPPPFSDVVTKKNGPAFVIQGELPGSADDAPSVD